MNHHSLKFFNGRIFTGDTWMDQIVIRVSGERIVSVSQFAPADEEIDLGGKSLVPAFIDLQIYGGDGCLFGEHPGIEALQATIAQAHRGGAALILPTVATNTNEVVFSAVDAIRAYWSQGGAGVAGLHLEGPFLNQKRKGAHIQEMIQPPTVNNIRTLLDYGRGVIRMMTIAPELFSKEGIQILQDSGIVLSAGHSNADFEQANAAFHQGITTCTHLFNAMPPLLHRDPGLVGAILNHPSVMSSIVADGYHVKASMIAIAKKIMGERLFLITDAVTSNNTGYYQHHKDGNRYLMPDGTLSGSSLTMAAAVKFCVEMAGIEEGEALRMASLYPARVLGLDMDWGKIAPGYLASNWTIIS